MGDLLFEFLLKNNSQFCDYYHSFKVGKTLLLIWFGVQQIGLWFSQPSDSTKFKDQILWVQGQLLLGEHSCSKCTETTEIERDVTGGPKPGQHLQVFVISF